MYRASVCGTDALYILIQRRTMMTLYEQASEIVNRLKEEDKTVTFVESLTCGLAAATFGQISGVSHVFKGSMVTYSNEVKQHLGVDDAILEKEGAVSRECAKQMAIKGAEWMHSDYALSFTGVAGPHSVEGKEVGLVYIGLYANGKIYVIEKQFDGNREAIQQQVVSTGFDFLLSSLNHKKFDIMKE